MLSPPGVMPQEAMANIMSSLCSAHGSNCDLPARYGDFTRSYCCWVDRSHDATPAQENGAVSFQALHNVIWRTAL